MAKNDVRIKKIDPSQIKYTPQENEIIQTPKGEYLIYQNGTWNKINMENSNIEIGLYDINQQIISQLPALTEEQINSKIELVTMLYQSSENKYYMLYGKEMSYFTLFEINNQNNFFKEIIECLNNIGIIKCFDFTETKDAIEIWVEYEDEPTCLYLFPYDSGVVKVN